MANVTVGTNSWVTELEANDWMESRMGAGDYWEDGGPDNKAALITAYQWLNAGNYSFPAVAVAIMKQAQYEMALFLLQHQPDIDLRMGLQVQGVIQAGVVKEKYKNDNYTEIPFPPVVQKLIEDYQTSRPVFLVDLFRNENESVGYDAFANRLTDTAENQ